MLLLEKKVLESTKKYLMLKIRLIFNKTNKSPFYKTLQI